MIPWQAGVQLGPYVLVSPIGSGGMGEVWKARDTRLDRTVAIKTLAPEHMERFENEARAIAALNHPHICTLHDVGPDYLVMEFVEGAPMQGPLPEEEAVRLAVQIAGALEEAHGKGIVHRDLKPANILVSSSGVKLLDFGLAKPVPNMDDVTATSVETGTVMGTAAYMSPEQAQGGYIDVRSDIFTFGVVLYEMLTGRRPFTGTSPVSVIGAILHKEPLPINAPAEIGRVVMRCLRKVPEDRFQTMTEVRLALEQIPRAGAQRQPSIAVLPFANMSADKENEYFSDGLAEEIINVLTHVPGLKVTARTSAFAFRGKDLDVRTIAETLGVRAVLEGSVRRAGSRIRVTAQLINTDGYHLWSQRFDREMADVFTMQDEIAQAIAAALQVKLAPSPRELQRRAPSLPAYEAYLKARHYWGRLTPNSLARCRECLQEAIAHDPGFAAAHCQLGDYFLALASIGMRPARETVPLVRAAALKALELDPSLPEAHAMLGVVAGVFDFDWKEAGRRFELAMAREPIPPTVRHWYGYFYLLLIGRPLEALEQQERALQEDPLNLICRIQLIACLQSAGKEAESAAQLRQLLQLDDRFWTAHLYSGIRYALQERFTEALASAERAFALAPWYTGIVGLLAGALKRTGDHDRAGEMLERLKPADKYGVPIGMAVYHAVCSEPDLAVEWTEKAIEQRDPRGMMILHIPLAKVLRASSRWPALSKMMNLPEAGA